MSHFLDRLNYFSNPREPFAGAHGVTTAEPGIQLDRGDAGGNGNRDGSLRKVDGKRLADIAHHLRLHCQQHQRGVLYGLAGVSDGTDAEIGDQLLACRVGWVGHDDAARCDTARDQAADQAAAHVATADEGERAGRWKGCVDHSDGKSVGERIIRSSMASAWRAGKRCKGVIDLRTTPTAARAGARARPRCCH